MESLARYSSPNERNKMKNNIKLIKIIKEIGRNARVDWIAILFLSVVTATTLAIGGVYLYNAVVKGDIQGNETPPAVSSATLNEKAISSVIADFDQRAEISKKARAGYSGVGDPSI